MTELPLFYRRPVPLSTHRHAEWRLKPGNLDFAAQCTALPVVTDEFAPASRSYPLLFSAQDAMPLVLLGLERRNLFVEDGEWAQDHYVPAYVRRYPFVFVRTPDPEGYALAIDADSGRVVEAGDEGVALFDGDQPSTLTRQALEFCSRFTGEHLATQAFSQALKSNGLLASRDASVTMPGGRRLNVTGFDVVDAEKFSALPEEVVVEWHRKGWLALVHFHMASLSRFGELLSRQGAHPAA
jgi:hypothetical protein